ncbi:hypothetical protein XFPR_12510 [Xylella fastidiosa]|uniref:Uncharacterized protein n=2 Tax=Xylella fastidiosa TaxID=2371 RepID=A0ABD7BXF9_XYLFS|nr:hypothetical protein [Xylella fastidiosa]AAF84982.1 hypothetical protein XF_2183 [Xylella fastidiosa 9a5c]ARO68316.1 hypothetical protein B9J09_03995 [Xylella fastidiosa subsp. pauca]MDG5823979.1 hypothetical protein [Xylella fastidiosa subsp. pauca]MDG5824748.1 hypothetical protein [Xylella fastidiosa subsp. pauca]QPB72577.1 hypothetical protein XFHB_13770 [Xylella fastidiosa]
MTADVATSLKDVRIAKHLTAEKAQNLTPTRLQRLDLKHTKKLHSPRDSPNKTHITIKPLQFTQPIKHIPYKHVNREH